MKKSKSSIRKKLGVLLSLIICMGMIIAGCGGKTTEKGSTNNAGSASGSGKTLTVAISASLTGNLANKGQEVKDAVTLLLEQMNNKVGDITIKPVWFDDQNDPNIAARAYEQAIVKDGAQVGLLSMASSLSVAMMEVDAKYDIAHFGSTGGTGVINEKWLSDKKYHGWLKMNPEPKKTAIWYVDVLENSIKKGDWKIKPEEKTYFNACEDTDWGRNIVSYFDKYMQAAGWKCVGTEFFNNSETDFLTLLSKIKGSGAKVIFGTNNNPASSAAFVKQSREQQVKALTILDGISENANFMSMTGDAGNYVIDCRPVYSNDIGFKFAKEFKAKYGYDSTPVVAGQAYDGFMMFCKVVKETEAKYGTVDAKTLRQFEEEEILPGKFVFEDAINVPAFKWSPDTNPDPVIAPDAYEYPVIQYVKGKPEVLSPASIKTGDLQIPDFLK